MFAGGGAGARVADLTIDDAELYHGAHVGLQIVGRRLQEEKMLAIAEYIGGLVGK